MLSPVLFGMVSNIMVGANLVPDALETGLLEYANIWGIYTIVIGTLVMIGVNQIRHTQKNEVYAKVFGKVLFCELLVIVTAGYIILPLCAYRW